MPRRKQESPTTAPTGKKLRAPTVSAKGFEQRRLESRLAAWREELGTDRYGHANIAPNCIRDIEEELRERWGVTAVPEEEQ